MLFGASRAFGGQLFPNRTGFKLTLSNTATQLFQSIVKWSHGSCCCQYELCNSELSTRQDVPFSPYTRAPVTHELYLGILGARLTRFCATTLFKNSIWFSHNCVEQQRKREACRLWPDRPCGPDRSCLAFSLAEKSAPWNYLSTDESAELPCRQCQLGIRPVLSFDPI